MHLKAASERIILPNYVLYWNDRHVRTVVVKLCTPLNLTIPSKHEDHCIGIHSAATLHAEH